MACQHGSKDNKLKTKGIFDLYNMLSCLRNVLHLSLWYIHNFSHVAVHLVAKIHLLATLEKKVNCNII